MKRATTRLALAAVVAMATSGPATASPLTADPGDLAVIRDAMVASLLPTTNKDVSQLIESARLSITRMTPDGTWPDVDVANVERNNWKLRTHLDRALVLAKAAAAIGRRDGRADPALAKASAAARFPRSGRRPPF